MVGSDGTLTAASYEPLREKARIINCQNSNKYNITQDIAETFELFCSYEYKCDDRGHFVKSYTDSAGNQWTGRKVVFYNRAIKKDNPLTIEYKKNLNSISRESDSSEIYTKLYVSPIASDVMTDGYVSIANSAANPTMDEFILNFDYLHDVGSISEYQYGQVEVYKANVRKINKELADLAPQIDNLTVEINDLEAEAASYESQISSAEEQLANYQKLRDNALTNGVIQKDKANSCSVVFSDVGAYKRATLNFEGIVASTINGYAKSDYATKIFSASSLNIVSAERIPSGDTIDLILDDTGFPCALATKRVFESNIVYLELQYSPANKYKKVCDDLWREKQGAEGKLASAEAKIAQKKIALEKLEQSYSAKLAEKESLNLAFENLMGPALREGYWTADDYQDPRENFTKKLTYSTTSSRAPINSEPIVDCFMFDAIPFEDEQLAWAPDNSAPDKKKYYKYFLLDSIASKLTENFQIFLNREFVFTAKSGGEVFIKGNYCIIYDSRSYYFSLSSDTRVSQIRIQSKQVDGSYIGLTIIPTSGSNISIKAYPTPLANPIDISSKFEGVGTYLGSYVLYENAGFVIAYMNIGGAIKPVALLNDDNIPYDSYVSAYIRLEKTGTIIFLTNYAVSNTNKYELCYPRLFLAKDNILYDADTLTITQGAQLEKFEDYSILVRNGKPYITLKNFRPNLFAANTTYTVNYQVSRANEMLYLDALQVAKDNSRPRYSYEVELANLPDELNSIELGQLAYINDYLLGAHTLSGYVSEIEYDLSMPKQDRIGIKNYKTKFEDLFSTISAQSEAMKVNKLSYDVAAGAFTPGGGLIGSVLQDAIAKENPYFDYSTCGVKITEDYGILLTNDKPYANGVYGQVAIRGSGIFVSDSIDPITGRRVWNNAISAGGINASLITTGQLDTNLIRIFSGDQMTFQWNSEGLIAYKYDGITGVDANTFIRFSDKGLQYYKSGLTNPVVSLDWDGLTLRNNNGDKTVYIDASTGNVVISGTIYATAGEIGGLKITNTALSDMSKDIIKAQGAAEQAGKDAAAAQKAADDAQKDATDGKTKAENIIGGKVSVPWVKSTGIEINGNNLTIGAEGSLVLQSNAGITLQTGAKFEVASKNFAIDEYGNVAMTGKITATSGTIGGLTIQETTLSDLNNTANNANSNVNNIINGTTAVKKLQTPTISIDGNNMTISAGGVLSLNSGTFTVSSGNFSIDANGAMTAKSGQIGGWTISTDRLYAGSGTSYVALNTNASYPAIWAGNSTYSSAPFRVDRDGSVYITSLYTLQEDGTPTKMDLRSNYWKMDSAYSHAVKTLAVENGVLTIALYNGTSVNFNKADLTGVRVGISAPGVAVFDASGAIVSGTYKAVGIPIMAQYSSSVQYDATNKILYSTSVPIYLGQSGNNITTAGVYFPADKALSSVTIDSLSLGGEPNFTNNSIDFSLYAKASNGNTKTVSGLSFIVSEYLPSSITRTSYSTKNKTVTVTASNAHGGTGGSISADISASEIYNAGVSDTKSKMVLEITPGSDKTLDYGGSQTVTAKILYDSALYKQGSITIKAPAAVTLDSLTFGSPTWVDNTHTSIPATATASNGETITDSAKIDVTAHYNAGVNYANSLYSTVNVTPISTAHRVSYVSFTRQGTGKSPKPRVLYNSAGQAVTVYDVGSAATVYTKGSKVEYYTVAYSGTVLYEAGTQKTYYTKS